MKSFRSRTRPSEAAPDKIVRLFQSETGEILETPEPRGIRITVAFLAVFFVSDVMSKPFGICIADHGSPITDHKSHRHIFTSELDAHSHIADEKRIINA